MTEDIQQETPASKDGSIEARRAMVVVDFAGVAFMDVSGANVVSEVSKAARVI